ncbi:MAG: sugar lactone lactonase YvrE [Litorivivens sp.]|jgi:sugar lactone lactonase YvrE
MGVTLMRTLFSNLSAATFGALILAGCGAEDEMATPSKELSDPILTTIATGANIAGTNGIAFSTDNKLYAVSVIGSTISIIDPDSGEMLKTMTAADGIVGPDDIAFGPDGSYFWTSILTGEVSGFTPDGYKVIAAQLTPGVNPITFSDDGRLFVSQCFFGTGLFEIDPKGIAEPRVIAEDLGPGCGLNGMDWGPDNRLYGPRWFRGEVVSFNVDDNTMRLEASGFKTPAAVKFDKKGILHVLDTGTGEVIKVEAENRTVVATLSQGLDNFAFDKDNRLFVSSFADGFIKRVEADGSLTTLQPGGLAHPGGITLFNDQLVVADLHAIRFFDPQTGKETEVQRNVLGMGKMGGALNLSADGDKLILVSWVDGDIRVWDPAAMEVVERHTGLAGPVAAVRYAGKIIATEHGGNRVIGLDKSGTTELMSIDTPTGLATANGDLYVTSRAEGTIYKIGSGNNLLPKAEIVVEGLTDPEGITIVGDEFIVVQGSDGKVIAATADGSKNQLATISPGSPAASPAQPPSMIFNGIVALPDGTLYATGETNRVLYKLTR